MNFNCHVRKTLKAAWHVVEKGWAVLFLVRRNRQDRAHMTGAEAPDMKVEHRIASVLHRAAYIFGQTPVAVHIQQDGARVPHQPVRPVRSHALAILTSNPNTATGMASLK